MDKLLSRAIRAKTQAARRLKKLQEDTKKRRLNNARKEHAAFQKLISNDRRTSRAEEKEDHRLGPLRPRRAVGKEELDMLGAFDQMRIIPPIIPFGNRIKYWNITVKERVVVLVGPDRHKIGVVKSVDKANSTLIVEGLNMMPMKIPEAFKTLDPDQPPIVFREQPIHYNDVRLVVPLPDPVTKELKDTVIANIAMSKVFHDRHEDTTRWTRYVQGTTIELPWPEKEEPVEVDQLCDTRIMDVETSTYVPTLLKPPFPISAMDELRNKYSKFRTRHESEFIARIEAEEKERQAKLNQRVRTPVQLLNKAEREKKKARGPPVMTEEILEQIGRVMAQNRPELLVKLKPELEVD